MPALRRELDKSQEESKVGFHSAEGDLGLATVSSQLMTQDKIVGHKYK